MSKALLKRSQVVVGMAKTLRGLNGDIRVVAWLAKRRAQIAGYLKSHAVKKLQLGTSNNVLKGWLNTDVFANHPSIVYLDVTRRFPLADGTFDYVMAEHMIEHIDYASGENMLRECFRVLKPGGRVRFATPDLRVLIELYSREKTDTQANYIDWLVARLMPQVQACKDVFVINNAFRAWGHSFLYDQRTLHHALNIAGFSDIEFYKPGASADPQLTGLESHGREILNEDINQFESMVVEARK